MLIFSETGKLRQDDTLSQAKVALMAESALSSLEKSGKIESSVSNSSAIPMEMDVAPEALCWQIELIGQDGQTLSSAKKGSCQCDTGKVLYARRAFAFRNSSDSLSLATITGRFCLK